MSHTPVIHINEYVNYTTLHTQHDYQVFERSHPDFGLWTERSINLGHIMVAEHQGNLTREVNVLYDDGSVKDYVHHCQSLSGVMGTQFHDQWLKARLTPLTFHTIFLPEQDYFFSMTPTFTNIHIAIARHYYSEWLCDSEKWSSEMKDKLLNNLTHYSGTLNLTPYMAQVIHSIFHSPLSGSLKKLLIEAQVQELVAQQLHILAGASGEKKQHTKNTELFYAIRDYLDRTFLEEHTLKGIARHFTVNEFMLKKGFRENFNTTVFDYLLAKRLEHSRELLTSTTQTIQQISSTVGYKYPNHFSIAFKKKFGVSPMQVR
jgi:AraC family transcriptional regulator, transcriptional activator of the genes for pyochelin and ferripyochelin receptors